ncbi:hypothetical protein KC328_g65 [Hortaea werneckii]|nr:hypothetical protein KC328_g65 [Hortaea werneckii]
MCFSQERTNTATEQGNNEQNFPTKSKPKQPSLGYHPQPVPLPRSKWISLSTRFTNGTFFTTPLSLLEPDGWEDSGGGRDGDGCGEGVVDEGTYGYHRTRFRAYPH